MVVENSSPDYAEFIRGSLVATIFLFLAQLVRLAFLYKKHSKRMPLEGANIKRGNISPKKFKQLKGQD